MERWAAVTVVAIPSQPALLRSPCVSAARLSALSPWASRAVLHNRHRADCILPILVRKLAVGEKETGNYLTLQQGTFLQKGVIIVDS